MDAVTRHLVSWWGDLLWLLVTPPWFHMATWLWPIAPALQAIKSQEQHQAVSIFLRNNPSTALVHIQAPTRDLIGYGQNSSLQTARNSVYGYKAGLQHCWILHWVVAEVHLPGMRGDTQSSQQHPRRDWVQKCPESFQRQTATLKGCAGRGQHWAHFLPGIWACGRRGSSCFLSSLPPSIVFL